MRGTEWSGSLLATFDQLVHSSVAGDPVNRQRQAWFIAARLLAGAIVFALFPAYVAFFGPPSLTVVAVIGLLALSILNAVYLSRTGNADIAYTIAGLLLSVIVLILAIQTGGGGSPMVAMLLLVPVEAVLSGKRRIVTVNAVIALLALFTIMVLSELGLFPHSADAAMPGIGLIWGGLLLYAFGTGLLLLRHGAQVESHARDHTELYRLLAENMSDVISTHRPDGAAYYVSPAITRLLGANADAATGERWLDLIHPNDRGHFLDVVNATRRTDDVLAADIRMRRARNRTVAYGESGPSVRMVRGDEDPDYVWVAIRCRNHRGSIVGEDGRSGKERVIVITCDATEEKRAEATMKRAREEAEKASEAKTRFLANMSHELRTPLNAVIGFSEVLEQQVFGKLGSERNLEYARLIHESGTHLLQVVNDILDMSKIETGRFALFAEPFSVECLVETCCAIVEPIARRSGVGLKTRIDGTLPELVADKRACKQMLLNLLSNAIKFSPDGGKVMVNCTLKGKTVVISVEDKGIGIAECDLPLLGQPFFQVDSTYSREHEGTGLGLSVVRGLVELHGGRMMIESAFGEGTKVSLFLPVNCEMASSGKAGAEPPLALSA